MQRTYSNVLRNGEQERWHTQKTDGDERTPWVFSKFVNLLAILKKNLC